MSFGRTWCTTHAFTLCFADSLRHHDAAGVPSAADRLLAQVISSLPVSLLIEGARNVDSCTGLQGFLVQNTLVVGTVLWCQVYASGTFVRRVRGPYSSWLHGVDPSAIATAVVESHFVCAPSLLEDDQDKACGRRLLEEVETRLRSMGLSANAQTISAMTASFPCDGARNLHVSESQTIWCLTRAVTSSAAATHLTS